MGADGHIKIYHLDRLLKIISEPSGYRYTIFGQRVLVTYWDNQNIDDTCINCGAYGGGIGQEAEKHKECESILERAEKCLVAEWEVWT